MAGSTVTSPIKETDVTVLKETLRSQQQLLQKLYAEIDVEREAASTATNEAMSMILRLQGEKAAMKMEASQYQRVAEEKISHAEESLEIFEELMYQKEMEISALEFRIDAYKYKLLSLGCEDLDDIDDKFSDNPFGEGNDGEKGIRTHIRRRSSLPSLLPTDFYKMKCSSGGEKHAATQMPDVGSSIDATNTDLLIRNHGMDSRKSSMEFNSYLEQIRMLDEKVKEISDCKQVSNNKLPNIKVKPASRSTSPTKTKLPTKSQKMKTCEEEEEEEEATPSSANSTNTIHDIFEVHCKFEVPESSKKNKSCFSEEKNKGKAFAEEDNRLKKPDMFMIGSPADDDDDIDWFNKDDFLSLKPGKKGYKLRDDTSPDREPYPDYESSVEYNTERGGKQEKRSCKPSDNCKPALLRRSNRTLNHRSALQQLAQRVEQLEGRGNNRNHGISEGREDELNLLMHLQEQLNSIQSEMRSWRPKKSSPEDEVPLVPLKEVMLEFWL